MTIKRPRWIAGPVLAMVLALSSLQASALSVSSSIVEIDWDSVSITSSSSLTLVPNGGTYADILSQLQVSQAWFDSVSIASSELPRIQYESLDTSISVDYAKQDSGGSITGSGESDSALARLETSASDQDGDNMTSNLIAADVSRGLRFDVSGTGQLNISFDYAAWLSLSAEDSRYNYTAAAAQSRLLVQEYVVDSTGGTTYEGSYQDVFSKTLDLVNGDDSFYEADRLSLALDFNDNLDRLLIITLYGYSRASAASGVASSEIPEPGTLALMGIALLVLAGMGIRRRVG